jgi:formylglycine-generating enzyme required for sulfatase activity
VKSAKGVRLKNKSKGDGVKSSKFLTFSLLLFAWTVCAADTNSIRDCADCPEMIAIPEGSFAMGDNNRPIAAPQHTVAIRKFALGKFEVTQREWQAVMDNNPSRFAGCDDCPVEQVSWDDAQIYLKRLSAKTGKSYRLPSEAEWEYACRAGKATMWCGGDTPAEVAWSGDEYGSTHPVGTRQPNAWGFYDMSGNVWEWTDDCSFPDYQNAPLDGSSRQSEKLCQSRILRGGSWLSGPQYGQAVLRLGFKGSYRMSDYGFRVARDI